jgi:hypothetical protein
MNVSLHLVSLTEDQSRDATILNAPSSKVGSLSRDRLAHARHVSACRGIFVIACERWRPGGSVIEEEAMHDHCDCWYSSDGDLRPSTRSIELTL